MNHVTHPLTSADISIFYRKSANFVTSRNTDIDFILVHNFNYFSFSCFLFNKPCYNFDDVNKNGYRRSP